MRIGFEVDFVSGGNTLKGLCRDVSDTGIRAEFEGSVDLASSGLLILCHPTGVLRIQAQVAYVEKCQVGLLFLFKTQWEREMTIEFINAIADQTTHSQVVQFP